VLFLFLCGCAQMLNQKEGVNDTPMAAGTEEPPTEAEETATDTPPATPVQGEMTPAELAAIFTEEDGRDYCSPEEIAAETGMIMAPAKPADPDKDTIPEATQISLDKALEYCRLSQDLWQTGELDQALDALDEAYNLMLDIDPENRPGVMQQIDDLRFMISKRILEIYASRNIVVNGSHQPIPMVMNDYVKKEIENLTKRDFFVQAYKRSGKYRAAIVEELKKAGLPEELSWLPLIESGYRSNALSRARALGLWQFIPSTGYKFGLKRNRYIDERLDPEKSTQAAIEYLKELHQIFGDWTTVLAAYNCGEGRVLKVIRNQNVNYLDNFWDLYEKLPRETARYVPRFLATLHIVRNLDEYDFDGISLCPALEYETVEVEKQLHLKEIAKAIGVAREALKELNPELRYQLIPDGGAPYSLKVPKGKRDTLVAKLDDLPAYTPPEKQIKIAYHRVRRGETLSTIAQRYKTTVSRIAGANGISRRNIIRVGKTLKIPLTKAAAKALSRTKRTPRDIKHVVKRGDSLWIIARKYGTTTKKIRRANHLTSSRLHIGQTLVIPGSESSASGRKTYRVRRGDVPSKIAERYNMPLSRFLRMNHLSKRSKIYPGQKLFVE
jgi:membrane-bound lytic murein transglycosylase D